MARLGLLPLVTLALVLGAPPGMAAASQPPDPLFVAIARKDAAGVTRLLRGGSSPNRGRFRGETPLLHAISRGDSRTARALIDFGADPFQVHAGTGKNAVETALGLGKLPVATYLLETIRRLPQGGLYLGQYDPTEASDYLSYRIQKYRHATLGDRKYREYFAGGMTYPKDRGQLRNVVRYFIDSPDATLIEDLRWACDQINRVTGHVTAVPVPARSNSDVSIRLVPRIPYQPDKRAGGTASLVGCWMGVDWGGGSIEIVARRKPHERRLILLHEMLHSLGVDHNPDRYSLMHASSFKGITQRFTARDKARLLKSWREISRVSEEDAPR